MKKLRVNIRTAVNAANASKDGNTYTVRDVVHALDGIVLNGRLYPGDQLQQAVSGLEGRPAPAGHPKDSQGRHISAANGEALAAAWIGAYCVNSRYEGGRAMCDIRINADQAQALPSGRDLLARLDAAIAGTSTEPIGVSSGLYLSEIEANGESRGKKYRAIANEMRFDHLAILLNETPAGTPEDGIGMFVNSDGTESAVEAATLDLSPADRRFDGLTGWLRKLLGNGSDMSFDQIDTLLRRALPDDAWPVEVFSRHVVWRGEDDKLYRQDYAIASDGASVTFTNEPVEVVRRVDYQPVTNAQEQDTVKPQIIAALNAAGINSEGMDDAALLGAYNAIVTKPATDKLASVTAKLAQFEANARAAEDAERDTLATELATNSALTAEDLKMLPLARLKEIKATAKGAAPVVVGNAGQTQASEFAGYDLNAILEGK